MDVLFRSPLGALLAKPWVDQAGLFGLKRWYFPLSRLWAAANAAGDDTARFRERDRRAGRRLAGALSALGAGAQRRPQGGGGGGPLRLGDVAVRRCAGRRRPAAGPPASCRRHPPSGDARFVLSAAVSDPATVGALGDRPAGRCRARSRAGDRPARQPLRCCRRRRHRRRFTAGDERWRARVLAARADARGAAAPAARQ